MKKVWLFFCDLHKKQWWPSPNKKKKETSYLLPIPLTYGILQWPKYVINRFALFYYSNSNKQPGNLRVINSNYIRYLNCAQLSKIQFAIFWTRILHPCKLRAFSPPNQTSRLRLKQNNKNINRWSKFSNYGTYLTFNIPI